MADERKVVLLIFSYICIASAAYNTVPALLWSSRGSQFPSSLAGHKLTSDKFHSDYLQNEADDKQNFVALLQDKLSLEDITQNANVYSEESNGGVFQNLKHLMESHSSVHLPNVERPTEALNTLKNNFQGKIHELKAPYNIKDLPLDPEGGNLVIAHLPDTHTRQTDNSKTLEKIDQILGSVTDDLKSLGKPYTALYTGQQSSKVDLKRENMYQGRHLLADSDDFLFFNQSGCILFYATGVKFEVFKVSKSKGGVAGYSNFSLPLDAESDGGCDNGTANLKVTWTKGLPYGLNRFDFTILFGKKSGMWKISNWTVNYDVVNGTEPIKGRDRPLQAKDIYAPLKFSYHCTNPSALREIQSGNSSDYRIQLDFDDLQVQPIKIVKGKFGYPNDCIGFFTIPIWSGIISAVVLIAVLMFGLHMIADINTPDRFDDPKGKTISVSTSD